MIDTLTEGGVLENCRKMGEYLLKRLMELKAKYSCIQDVRGKGLMLGVVLDFPATELLGLLREKGFLALSAGETVLRLVPPLIITEKDCDQAVSCIDATLAEYTRK